MLMMDSVFWIIYSFCCHFFIFVFILFALYLLIDKLLDKMSGIQKRTSNYILITGCDSGFGLMAAKAFSEKEFHVFAACLTQAGADRLIKDPSFRGTAFIMDLTNIDDINKAKQMIENETQAKGLWGILNNAGICDVAPFEWMLTDEMKNIFEINVWGAINVTRAMLPLIKRANGRIVSTGSVHGKVPCEFFSAYCMSKTALWAFSESLRYEMIPWGVGVSFIESGFHNTGLAGKLVQSYLKRTRGLNKEILEEYGESYSMDILKSGFQTIFQYPNDPNGVIKTYMHAILSTRPKAQYLVGLDANTIYFILATLPTQIGDLIKYSLTSIVPIRKK